MEPPPHIHNTPHQAHPHNNTRIQNILHNQRPLQIPYYLSPLNHTPIIGMSHPLITKHTQPPTTYTYTLLFIHNSHLSKHNIHQCQPYQPTLLFLYSLFIILYFFYNHTNIPIIGPSSMIYKLPHTLYQQISTHPRTKINTLATLIKHHLIITPRITKLIKISLTVIFLLSLNLPTHQAHSLPPQHIHPTNPTKILASYRTLHKSHLNPNPTLNADFKQKPYQKHKLTSVYRRCHEPKLKHHTINQWKPRTSTKHILHKNMHTYLPIRHITHHHHQLATKNPPYSRLKSRNTHTLYPKNKMALPYRLHHTTNNLTQNNHSNHKTHPNFQHHIKLTHQSKFTSHSTHKPHPTRISASAYRPRHTYYNTYHLIENWKPNFATNPIPMNHTKTHFSPKHVVIIILAIPNLFTTTTFTITIYTKTNMKHPKIHYFNGYYFINKLELLKCGDVELNPGPMPNILHTHTELTYILSQIL